MQKNQLMESKWRHKNTQKNDTLFRQKINIKKEPQVRNSQLVCFRFEGNTKKPGAPAPGLWLFPFSDEQAAFHYGGGQVPQIGRELGSIQLMAPVSKPVCTVGIFETHHSDRSWLNADAS